MNQVALAALLALFASAPAYHGSPCDRTRLGPVGVPTFAGSRPNEMEIQRDCLAWEAAVEPKAEFLPPSKSSALGSFAVQPAIPGPPRPKPAAVLPGSESAPSSFSLGIQSLVPAGVPARSPAP
jgi:hypothetical protein